MNYLPTLPSLDTVKGYFLDAKTHAVNTFDTYYPVVRDGAKEYAEQAKDAAGRAYVYVKEKAIENPAATFAGVNFALILLYNKITRVTNAIFSLITDNVTALKVLNNVVFWGVLVPAVNFALYNALEITAEVAAIAFGCALVAGTIVLGINRTIADRRKAEHLKLGVDYIETFNTMLSAPDGYNIKEVQDENGVMRKKLTDGTNMTKYIETLSTAERRREIAKMEAIIKA